MPFILTRESILSAEDLKPFPVDVPEWGKDAQVLVRRLDGSGRKALMNAISGLKEDTEIQRAVAVHCIVNQDGSRVFTDTDADLLAKKAGNVIARIADAAFDLNRIGKTAVETIEKN